MQKGEYIVIKKCDINRNLELLKNSISGTYSNEALANFINFIEANPTDLYDAVEDALNEGVFIGDNIMSDKHNEYKNDYLNNLEI
jgi:hypothetical protein